MSDALEQSKASLDAEVQAMLDMLAPDHVPTGDRPFCVVLNAEAERNETVFYYPRLDNFDKTGTIIMRASGYTDTSHWSGAGVFPPSHPDYSFWVWIVKEKRKGRVGNHDFETLKKEFDSL